MTRATRFSAAAGLAINTTNMARQTEARLGQEKSQASFAIVICNMGPPRPSVQYRSIFGAGWRQYHGALATGSLLAQFWSLPESTYAQSRQLWRHIRDRVDRGG